MYTIDFEINEMSNYAIIGIAKLKGAAIGSSDSHADRTRETLNADEALLDQNRYLRGGKTPLRELLNENFKEFGGKQRKDAVECLEFMCTASPEFFSSELEKKEEKLEQFIERIEVLMIELETRGIKIIKAVIHVDETTPHASLFGPGRDEKGVLNAKRHVGTRTKMASFHDLYAEVMKPLGLKRGRRRAYATHHDVKQFYNTIISEPVLQITSEQVPNPPEIIKNDDQRAAYKEQVVAAVKAEIVPQIARMRNQAMLTNHYKGFKEAAEERAAKLNDTLRNKDIELKYKDDEIEDTRVELQKFEGIETAFAEVKKQLTALQNRHSDLPFTKVSEIFAHKTGVASNSSSNTATTSETYFSDGNGRLSFYIEDAAAYTLNGEKYAETAIELSQKILRQDGRAGTVPEVIAGLAEHFNDEEITSAVSLLAYRKVQSESRELAAGVVLREDAGDDAPGEMTALSETGNAGAGNLSVEGFWIGEDEELSEILNEVLPTEKIKPIPSLGEGINLEKENQNETLAGDCVSGKREFDEEGEEIKFTRGAVDAHSGEKFSEPPVTEAEEPKEPSEFAEIKPLVDEIVELKADAEADAKAETVLPEQISDSPVAPQITRSQDIQALLMKCVFSNPPATSESSEAISAADETSRAAKQTAGTPILAEETGAEESGENVPVKVVDDSETDGKKQSETLIPKENTRPQKQQSSAEAVKDSDAIKTLLVPEIQTTPFATAGKVPVADNTAAAAGDGESTFSLNESDEADSGNEAYLSENESGDSQLAVNAVTQTDEIAVSGAVQSDGAVESEKSSAPPNSVAKEEFTSDAELIVQREVESLLSRQLGRELIARIELRKALFDENRFKLNVSDERLKVTVDIGNGSELAVLSRTDLLRERRAIAQYNVDNAETSGILEMLAEDEGKTIDAVKKIQIGIEIGKAKKMQNPWTNALDEAISEETAHLDEKVSESRITLEKEQSETSLVAGRTGSANIEKITPTLAPEKICLEQIEAVKRGDVSVFTRLEEINRAAGLPRSTDSYSRLRAMETVAAMDARREDRNHAQSVGRTGTGNERIIINVREEKGELKLENWRVKKVEQAGEQLAGDSQKDHKTAADERAIVVERELRPLINKISLFASARRATPWRAKSNETPAAHRNPIEIVENDPAVQIVRAVAEYIEHKNKGEEFNKLADSATRKAKALRENQAAGGGSSSAGKLAEAIKAAILNEEALRVTLKTDSSANAEQLKTPTRRFTFAELKRIGEIAMKTGDVEQSREYVDLLKKDALFAETVGESEKTLTAKSLLSGARAVWEAKQSIETVKQLPDGSIDVEINPALFRQALEAIETANVLKSVQLPTADESIISKLSLEDVSEIGDLLAGNNELADSLYNQIYNLGGVAMDNLRPPLNGTEQQSYEKLNFTPENWQRFESIENSEQFYDEMGRQAENQTQNEMSFRMQAHNLLIVNRHDETEAKKSKFWENERNEREAVSASERAAKRSNMTDEERAQADASALAEAEGTESKQNEETAGRKYII